MVYEKEDIKLIAETIYDTDFGDILKMNQNMHKSLSLDHGAKWIVKEETMFQIKDVNKLLTNFGANKLLEDYNTLWKDVFDLAKVILMDKSYSEETFEVLHSFFNNVETNMHNLIAESSLEKAKKEHRILIKEFSEFDSFFENKK